MRKKTLFLILLVLAVSLAAGYIMLKKRLTTDLTLNAKVAVITDKVEALGANSIEALKNIETGYKKFRRKIMRKPLTVEEDSPKGMRIHLKKGGVMDVKLLKKFKNEYTVDWKGGEFVVSADQIDRIEYVTQKDLEWPYKNDVVVKRTNGIVSDGRIIYVDKDKITLSFDEGGGGLEMDVNRSQVECLMFAPVYNKESREIEERLKTLFPKMKFYKEDNIVIVTDSYDTWVKAYKKIIRESYTNIYLEFFKLFKNRKPLNQNFIVIFDDPIDYLKFMYSDMGMASYNILGYFKPTDNVLYLYNAWGKEVEKYYFGIIFGITDKYDQVADKIKDRYKDGSVDIQVDGLVDELKNKYWDWYNLHKDLSVQQTFETLRHEFTHEIFHTWGLQSIILSRTIVDKKKMAEKQKEIIDTLSGKDEDKREELFKELGKLKHGEYKNLELEGAQSWLAEGLATYCETEPMGNVSQEWLYTFQEMEKKNEINPIEFLTNFKMGSFPGLCSKAQLDSYAQSWAFTSFLMTKYRDQFMEFQNKKADMIVRGDEKEELDLLLKSLNKDLPALEKEFREHMAAYKKVEDPYVTAVMRYEKIRESYRDAVRRRAN